MKHERNKNHADWNKNRDRASRTFTMTDEDHGKIKRLAAVENKSLTKAVIDAVEEKLDRITK